jgi:hypothetical protein
MGASVAAVSVNCTSADPHPVDTIGDVGEFTSIKVVHCGDPACTMDLVVPF